MYHAQRQIALDVSKGIYGIAVYIWKKKFKCDKHMLAHGTERIVFPR